MKMNPVSVMSPSALFVLFALLALHIAVVVAVWRDASRQHYDIIAWPLLVAFAPVVGTIAYLIRRTRAVRA
jgi:uncharacterized membrane protein YhaH (DUF805 family)